MKFKICTCWDDGVVNDERLAVLLRRHGAKATFNLNPGNMPEQTRTENHWLSVGELDWSFRGFRTGRLSLRDIPEVYAGFELASHCWRHESAGAIPDADWIRAAVDARKFLEDIVQRPCTGFAWPNGLHTPGTEALLRDAGFTYGRTTHNVADFLSENPEPMALSSNAHFLDLRRFWSAYAAAKEKGGVFYFWGHSYEMMEYDRFWKQMDDILSYIEDDPDAEWVTVEEAVKLLPASTLA